MQHGIVGHDINASYALEYIADGPIGQEIKAQKQIFDESKNKPGFSAERFKVNALNSIKIHIPEWFYTNIRVSKIILRPFSLVLETPNWACKEMKIFLSLDENMMKYNDRICRHGFACQLKPKC